MSLSRRWVEPEVLDGLEADDPRAQRSRRDLRRVNAVMRAKTILMRAVTGLHLARQPHRIIELGAGDGTLLLQFAKALEPGWSEVELTLVDRLDLVTAATREAYRELGWNVTVECADALGWAVGPEKPHFDLCIANLFLHHFDVAPLAALLQGIASTTDAFVACEPRRSTLARLGSRLVWFLGANDVTREDAVKSVTAGFAGHEISSAWTAADAPWSVAEYLALPFTHCFTAVRSTAQAAEPAPVR